MTNLFDTHAHFDGPPEAIAELLRRARAAGVTRILAVGGSEALNAGARRAVALSANAADGTMPRVWAALGWDRDQVDVERPALETETALAIGEIGLDYFYTPETRLAQGTLFASELARAAAAKKPVVIHTRGADDDTLGFLREIPSRGIIHCFTGSPAFARQLLDLGFYISISGIVTFRRAEEVREMARLIPSDRLLIETDSPFLAPVPKRGTENEPAFVAYTAAFLAELRGRTVEDFVRETTQNAMEALCIDS